MAPRGYLFATVIVLIVGVSVGCSRSVTPKASKAFCLAADRYDNEITRQQKKGELDVDRQIERVAEIARTAPEEIKADAEVFLDALQRVDEDKSLKDDPKVREAVDDVNRFANQACGVYRRQGGI